MYGNCSYQWLYMKHRLKKGLLSTFNCHELQVQYKRNLANILYHLVDTVLLVCCLIFFYICRNLIQLNKEILSQVGTAVESPVSACYILIIKLLICTKTQESTEYNKPVSFEHYPCISTEKMILDSTVQIMHNY